MALTKEAKKAAADMFRFPDWDADDSSTASESEVERLENYPSFPSPESASKRYKERMAEAAKGMPRQERAGGKVKARDLEEVLCEKDSTSSRGGRKEEEDGGIGAVVIDPVVNDFGDDSNRFRAYQIERQTTTSSSTPQDLPPQHMGLFAQLPGELRNRIYRLALLARGPPLDIRMEPNTCSLGPCVHMKLPTAVPGLLSACQQIRNEALPVFCSENEFRFDAKTVRERCVANFLRTLGPYGRMITTMSLYVAIWRSAHPDISEAVFNQPGYLIRVVKRDQIMDVTVNVMIGKKAEQESQKLTELVEKLNDRLQKGEMVWEEALLEFVWSDLLADVVWRCQKNR